MENTNDSNNEKKGLQIILFVIAGILVVFSFIAPYLFTRHGAIDFRSSGQIGDTIGGLMSPFIAIAGVIVAFLAFWMQKQANDIIVGQFDKKIKVDEDIEKTRKVRTVELMMSDVRKARKDIEERTEAILSFQKEIKDNPIQTRTLLRSPVSIYSRMSKFDRESLFDALLFSNSSDAVKLLDVYYSISDYMMPAINTISRITDSFEKEVYEGITLIKNNTEKILKINIDRGWSDKDSLSAISVFFIEYFRIKKSAGASFYTEMQQKYIGLGMKVSEMLNDDDFLTEKPQLLDVRDYIIQIVSSYTSIEQQSQQIINSLSTALNDFKAIQERCDLILSKTKSDILQ